MWISHSTCIFSASVLLLSSALLLYSLFCFTTSHHHTALAIPNQLQKNRNNNISSLSSSVKPVNHTPIANVGPDQTVNENATVMLVGVAIDPDPNDKLIYSWMQIAGPAVTLNGADTASPTFTAPSNVPIDTQLKFALTAKDNKGAASNNPAIVTITVKHANHPPVANAGTNQTAATSTSGANAGTNKPVIPNSITTRNSPAFVKVIILVNNTGGGSANPRDFTVDVTGDNSPKPNLFDGSEIGTIVTMGPGSYSIEVTPKDAVTGTYGTSYSGNCALNVGYFEERVGSGAIGQGGAHIRAGERQICTITEIFPSFK